MTADPSGFQRAPHRIALDPKSLWAGGIAAAVVAALIAVVGILICRGVLDIAVMAPKKKGAWGDASTVGYAIAAFFAALLATALIQLLYQFTPQPTAFFGWIVGLLILIAVVAPFVPKADRANQVATAILNLIIGIAIYSLVSGTARRSRIRPAGTATGYGAGPR
jgi:uncharacterized protein DUF6069